MKFYLSLFIVFAGLHAVAQNGYEIQVKIKPLQNQQVYLGHLYGKKVAYVDSVLLDNKSEGVFTGSKKLGEGMYLLTYPNQRGAINFLVTKNQRFSIIADTAQSAKLTFISSPENIIYAAYQDSLKRMTVRINTLIKEYEVNQKDSVRIVSQIERLQQSMQDFRTNTAKKDPTSLLGVLIRAMQDPQVPENHPEAKKDSMFAYKYFKAHFWDHINFYEDRYVRTHFFEPKLEYYFNSLVYPSADSVNKEIDWMLGYASASEEMQKFLLLHFVNRYMRQKNAWEDAVFLNLYEKYFSGKSYSWLAEHQMKNIEAKAYTIMANSKGKPAADIELPDFTGNKSSLYKIESPFTLLIIWDATCGHCKQQLPLVDSMYRNKWKAMGLKIFAMSKETDGSKNLWTSYITERKLTDWVHVYYSKADNKARIDKGLTDYSKMFDVLSFPTIYLLDKDKNIIAKKIHYNQVDDILKQAVGKK